MLPTLLATAISLTTDKPAAPPQSLRHTQLGRASQKTFVPLPAQSGLTFTPNLTGAIQAVEPRIDTPVATLSESRWPKPGLYLSRPYSCLVLVPNSIDPGITSGQSTGPEFAGDMVQPRIYLEPVK